jgi:hypothetical protein
MTGLRVTTAVSNSQAFVGPQTITDQISGLRYISSSDDLQICKLARGITDDVSGLCYVSTRKVPQCTNNAATVSIKVKAHLWSVLQKR